MPAPKKLIFSRPGPDALLLHLLQSLARAGVSGNAAQAQQKMHDLLAGIKKYQTCNMPPVVRDHAVIWQQGPVRLLHLKSVAKGKRQPPIILIPSLVNGWEILDLLPDLSFARYLQQSGFDVHIIDWGDLRKDPHLKTVAHILNRYLGPLVRMIAGTSGEPVTTIGYCMGGLLMAGAMPEMMASVRAQIYLATPWDFHAGNPVLTQMIKGGAPSVTAMLATTDYLPNTQIQMLFAQVDPDMAINKFSRFLKLDMKDKAAEIFVAVEDWLRTGRDLPCDMAMACIHDWYLENQTGQGKWEIEGTAIDAKLLARKPALVVAPSQDRLVETQTAQALARALGRTATLHTPEIGHIGMMSSPRARDMVWAPLVEWIKALP